MAKCPKCGSSNVMFQLRHAGTTSSTHYYRHGVKSSWIIPAGRKTRKSETRQKSVGLCNNCGYSWTASSERSGWFYLLCILFLPITLLVLLIKASYNFIQKPSERLSKGWRIAIVCAAWSSVLILELVIGLVNAAK